MLHTSMDFFVKHIAYLIFLILAQKEKFVKLFWQMSSKNLKIFEKMCGLSFCTKK